MPTPVGGDDRANVAGDVAIANLALVAETKVTEVRPVERARQFPRQPLVGEHQRSFLIDHPVDSLDSAATRRAAAAGGARPAVPARAAVGGVDDGGDVLQRHADVPQRGQGPRPRQLASP